MHLGVELDPGHVEHLWVGVAAAVHQSGYCPKLVLVVPRQVNLQSEVVYETTEVASIIPYFMQLRILLGAAATIT